MRRRLFSSQSAACWTPREEFGCLVASPGIAPAGSEEDGDYDDHDLKDDYDDADVQAEPGRHRMCASCEMRGRGEGGICGIYKAGHWQK